MNSDTITITVSLALAVLTLEANSYFLMSLQASLYNYITLYLPQYQLDSTDSTL